MNAKEMFEKLGYKQELRKVNPKSYTKDDWIIYHKGIHGQAFVFSLNNLTLWTNNYENIDSDSGEIYGITPQEIQAITQQMKELGWIE